MELELLLRLVDCPSAAHTSQLIDQMTRNELDHIPPATSATQLRRTVDSMFSDNVWHWGRIATIYAYAARTTSVDPPIVALIVDKKTRPWIDSNGGWNAIASNKTPRRRRLFFFDFLF